MKNYKQYSDDVFSTVIPQQEDFNLIQTGVSHVLPVHAWVSSERSG